MIKPINEYKDEGELHRDLSLSGYRPGTHEYEHTIWMFRTTVKQRKQEFRINEKAVVYSCLGVFASVIIGLIGLIHFI